MKLYETNGVKYFKFDNLENLGFVNHCFSTRVGGVSQGEFESLNLSYSRGDKRENVDENFKRICEANNMDYKKLVFGKQIHDNKVMEVSQKDAGCGVLFRSEIEGFDGFMTNKPETVLVTFHADCVSLFFVDTKNKAIALSHSGWKGTVRKIAKETVRRMIEVYGTNPEDIVAAIGPSIGKCCFQVSLPVAEEFRDSMDFADKYIAADLSEKGKYKIDLWEINKELMIESGIKEENIEITDRCTMCDENLFYSHRKMGDKRGSLAGFISLKA